MKAHIIKDAFSPLCLIIETPYEYEALMLALRIGADGMRQIEIKENELGNLGSKLVEQARTLLDQPELTP